MTTFLYNTWTLLRALALFMRSCFSCFCDKDFRRRNGNVYFGFFFRFYFYSIFFGRNDSNEKYCGILMIKKFEIWIEWIFWFYDIRWIQMETNLFTYLYRNQIWILFCVLKTVQIPLILVHRMTRTVSSIRWKFSIEMKFFSHDCVRVNVKILIESLIREIWHCTVHVPRGQNSKILRSLEWFIVMFQRSKHSSMLWYKVICKNFNEEVNFPRIYLS